jgi:hypothetical protein
VTLEPQAIEPPPPSTRLPEPTRGGASPVWFFTALALTGVAAGLSVWSGIDTLGQHSSFENAGCIQGAGATCSSLRSEGLAAQTRTNILLGGTAVLAATTLALGIFVVRWQRSSSHETGLFVHGSGVSFASAF